MVRFRRFQDQVRLPFLRLSRSDRWGIEFTFLPGRAIVVVTNKESLAADMDENVREAFSGGRLSRHAAQTLRGRITFARTQLFGKCSAPTFRASGAVPDRTRVSSDHVECQSCPTLQVWEAATKSLCTFRVP